MGLMGLMGMRVIMGMMGLMGLMGLMDMMAMMGLMGMIGMMAGWVGMLWNLRWTWDLASGKDWHLASGMDLLPPSCPPPPHTPKDARSAYLFFIRARVRVGVWDTGFPCG